MKNNKTLFRIAQIAMAVGIALVAGQASAHVSYGKALFDDSPAAAAPATGTVAETKYMRLSNANKGALPTQTTTISSNAGFYLSRKATTWANSHDQKFFWFYISRPYTINVKITGNTNAPYVSAVPGSSLNGIPQARSTLIPSFALFQGVAPRSAHDGAYSPYNTGFAPYSSWAQQALPAGQATEGDSAIKYIGIGSLNSQGNPVFGRAYRTDAASANVPNTDIAAGTSSRIGIYGGWWMPGTGPLGEAGFWAANNKGTTNQDGSEVTSNYGFLRYVTFRASTTETLDTTITLVQPGVYSLVVGGNNAAEGEALLRDARLTGMGPSGCPTDPNLPSIVCLNGSPATIKAQSSNPAAKASGIGDWDRYRNVDRGARSFTIEFSATPK